MRPDEIERLFNLIKVMEKKVLSKLGLKDARSTTTIMLNDELVNRIVNESPIWINDAIKKYEITPLFIQKLINNGLLSSFANSNNQGSKRFIFENELINYLPFYHSKTFIEIDKIKDIVKIASKFIDVTERDYALLVEYLKDGATVESVGEKFNLTRERARQVLERTKRKIVRFAKNYEENSNLQIELVKLRQTHSFLTSEIERLTKNKELATLKVDIKLEHIKIIDLDFSVRTLNCLKAADIYTMYDLLQYSMSDLLKFKNFGKKSQSEIMEYLDNNKISYKMR